MGTSQAPAVDDVTRKVLDETERRLDAYYDLARPGEPDSPIEPMTSGDNWAVVVVAAALLILWLIGRFVVLPMFV
ncbi:MAG: hypothetical protein Kow00122_01580 [Thermoleophilia bacterium]